jgi:hypothetical protein
MKAWWVRSYRPDLNRFDERPAVLNGGYLTADPEDLAEFAAAALRKRGSVVVQRAFSLADDEDTIRVIRNRAAEAERAEARR